MKGFTLIELLIFTAIFSIVIVSLITVFVSVIGVQSHQSAAASVSQESLFLIKQIQYYASSGRLIDMTQDSATSTLTIREFLAAQDPTSITTVGTSSAPISLVQTSSAYCAGTDCTITISPSAAGDMIVVGVEARDDSNQTISSITDNQSSTYLAAWNVGNIATHYSSALFYTPNTVAGITSITVNIPSQGNSITAIAEEYKGVATTNPYDAGSNPGNGTVNGSLYASANVTTTLANELLVGYTLNSYSCAIGFKGTNGWNAVGTQCDDFSGAILGLQQQIVTSAGSYANTGILSGGSNNNYAGIATFKAASIPSGRIYLTQGINSTPQALTSNKVTVSNLFFTRNYNVGSSAAFGTDLVSYSFTMSATSTNNSQYSQTFRSSVLIDKPVPKIVLIQQTSTVANSPSVSSISATYSTNNETSSLLIAVVANTTSSATTTVSDTAGNTWTQIASTSYPAYNTKLSIFDVTSAINSSNTVTAQFGPGAGYASLFLYEYRNASSGASTGVVASSFDASSTQIQLSTASPSSGYANATSAVELLFGVAYSGGGQVPLAGTGYTLETTSTVTNVSVEDTTQYVTGPVAATWSYASAQNSSAVLVTFH